MCLLIAGTAGCKDKEKDKASKSSVADESSIMEVMVPLQMPDIDISIPDDYEKTSTDSNNVVYIKNDASIIVNSDNFRENCDTVREYVDFAVESYKKYSDELEILSRESLGEGELLEFIYSINTDNGVFSKYCMVAFYTDDEKMYLVTCKADTDTYVNYRNEFIAVAESVKLK